MSTLMKKTKAELVDLILRKDDEEKRLNGIIEELKATIKTKDDAVSSMYKDLGISNKKVEEYQETIDDITSEKVEAQISANKFKKQRNTAEVFVAILSCVILSGIVLHFIF